MSQGQKVGLMKWACSSLLATLLLGATLAMAQVQDKGVSASAALRYKVVRMPANIVEGDYNSDGKPRRPPVTPIHPLDDLSAEGWELVSAVHGDGGDFVCFLRKRK